VLGVLVSWFSKALSCFDACNISYSFQNHDIAKITLFFKVQKLNSRRFLEILPKVKYDCKQPLSVIISILVVCMPSDIQCIEK